MTDQSPSTSSEADDQPATFGQKLWRSWIKPIGVAVLTVVTFRSAVADWNDVPSQSMEPTILIGDRIFVNKLAYDLKVPFTTWHVAEWSEPQRGDVVIFFHPQEGHRMVKRVVGVPGDVVEMRSNVLYINGTPASYQPLPGEEVDTTELADPAPWAFASEHLGDAPHPVMSQPMRPAMRTFAPVTVTDGHYFVLGDNRDNSGDSRKFGLVPRSKITGKAIGLAFSLDKDRSYAPRWDRFFTGLD